MSTLVEDAGLSIDIIEISFIIAGFTVDSISFHCLRHFKPKSAQSQIRAKY
jgi:hypothetical protein